MRAIARDWLPPALVRAARRTRANGAAPSAPVAPVVTTDGRVEKDASFYDATFHTDPRWTQPYWKMQWYACWSVIADRVMAQTEPAVLDIGCGAGHLARLLRDRGLERYVGFDFSAARLEQAARLVPEFTFEVADAYTTDLFERARFDIVTCCDVLEHLDDLAILDRIPAGTRLLGTVPSYDSEAHLRYFRDARAVVERYESRLAGLAVESFRNTTDSIEFLVDGTRR